jgi:ABC-type branched-subunit amino acid transport system permease subunit
MSHTTKVALAVLVLVLIVFPLLTNPYVTQIAITTITYSMLGLACALSMRVGLVRIDIAAWWGVGGYTTALLMSDGMSFWLAALLAGIITAFLGWLAFSLVLPRGMLHFFIFCMFALFLAPKMLQWLGKVPFLRGSAGTVPVPIIGAFEFIAKRDLYYLGLGFLGLTLLAYYLLYNSKIGRAWKSINSSIGLARSLGINVVKYRMSNILIGNFFIALAGSYFVAYYRASTPMNLSLESGVLIMVYPFIGGLAHSLTGSILGALITTFVPNYLNFAKEYQIIITSSTVLLILIFLPQGILGWIDQKLKPWFYRRQWYVRLSEWGAKK